ncbi:hypothetical protein V8F06_005293, partial [Rhypophila decipiens]
MSSNSYAAYSRLQNRAMGRPDPQDPTDENVLWQTLFFGVLTAAFSVASQDAGSVCSQPRRVRVALRSSPLICAIDTIFLLVKWLSVMWLGYRPVSAARRVCTSAFILTVVQSAKIFGTTGVPGTQALVFIFLAAYAIPEAFRMAFGSTDAAAASNSPAVVDRGFETIKYHLYPVETAFCLLAGIAHVAIALWTIARSIPARMFFSVHKSHGAADNLEMAPTSLSIYDLQVLVYQSYFIFNILGHAAADSEPMTSLRSTRYYQPVQWMLRQISEIMAIDQPGLKAAIWSAIISSMASMVTGELVVSLDSRVEHNNLESLAVAASLAVSLLLSLTVCLVSHLSYRIFFMGSFSSRPRQFFAAEGSMREWC